MNFIKVKPSSSGSFLIVTNEIVTTDSCVKVSNLVSSKSIETSFHAETSTLPMRFPVMHVVIVMVVGDSHLNDLNLMK